MITFMIQHFADGPHSHEELRNLLHLVSVKTRGDLKEISNYMPKLTHRQLIFNVKYYLQ